MAARWFDSSETSEPKTTDPAPSATVNSSSSSAVCEISESSSGLQQLCDSRPFAAVAAGLIVAAVLFWWGPPLVRCHQRSTYEAHNEYIAEVSIGKVLFWCIATGIVVYLIVPLVAKARSKR